MQVDLFTGETIVEKAILRLREFEPERGYYLAFSGGKDSSCIKALAGMAGVKYDAHYNATTLDPPELVRFIRRTHPDVAFIKPKRNLRGLVFMMDSIKAGCTWNVLMRSTGKTLMRESLRSGATLVVKLNMRLCWNRRTNHDYHRSG